MADKAIGSLVEATVINDADRFVLEQSGQAKQISGATMISELAEALDGHGGIQSIDLVSGDGNVKTYRITFTDGTTYDYEVRDGESGNYAVVAGNLAPYSDASGTTQNIPFLSQGTGRGNGSATVSAGNYCQLKKKLGNTVCVNQLAKTDGTGWNADSGGTFTFDSGSNTVNASYAQGDSRVWYSHETNKDHYYLITGTATSSVSGLLTIELSRGWIKEFVPVTANTPKYFSVILHPTSNTDGHNRCPAFFVDTEIPYTLAITELKIHELTVWFGSNDRIPSDLLAHPENWGRYYAGSLAYNAGTLESADGTVLTSVGRNVWDEEWEVGSIDENGNNSTDNTRIRSKNYISVIPNTVYCYTVAGAAQSKKVFYYDASKNYISSEWTYTLTFTIPNNACFMRFILIPQYGTTYKNDITISLYYSGESGYDQYYPYTVLAEVDTGNEQLLNWDSKAPDGTITRGTLPRIDMGTLTFATADANGRTYCSPIPDMKKGGISGYGNFFKTNLFVGVEKSSMVQLTDGEMSVDVSGYIQICKTAWANYSTEQLATALSGIYLEAEAATPTTEQGTAFAENIPCDPVGSMSWENTNGIPQGAEIFYPYDYAGTLDSIIDTLPSANGTYTLKATVTNGKITYSWVAG